MVKKNLKKESKREYAEKMQRGAWGGWESGGCKIESQVRGKIRKGWGVGFPESQTPAQMQFRMPKILTWPTLQASKATVTTTH